MKCLAVSISTQLPALQKPRLLRKAANYSLIDVE